MIPDQALRKIGVRGVESICPLCQQSEGQHSYFTNGYTRAVIKSFVEVDGVHTEAFFRHCDICDLGYFFPLPDQAYFNQLYSTEANTHNYGFESLIERAEQRKKLRVDLYGNPVLSFIGSHAKDINKLIHGRSIDVGCGEGEFIAKANAVGFHFEGADPVKVNCDFIQQYHKTKAFCGMVEDIPASEHGQFSLLTSMDSLEHHKSPLKTLLKFYDLLCDGGMLFITVPNLNSHTFQTLPFLHPYFAYPAHVNYFSVTSMQTTLSKLGFSDIDVTTTTSQNQIISCWEAAIKLGHIRMNYEQPSFWSELTENNAHESLYVCAVKR